MRKDARVKQISKIDIFVTYLCVNIQSVTSNNTDNYLTGKHILVPGTVYWYYEYMGIHVKIYLTPYPVRKDKSAVQPCILITVLPVYTSNGSETGKMHRLRSVCAVIQPELRISCLRTVMYIFKGRHIFYQEQRSRPIHMCRLLKTVRLFTKIETKVDRACILTKRMCVLLSFFFSLIEPHTLSSKL